MYLTIEILILKLRQILFNLKEKCLFNRENRSTVRGHFGADSEIKERKMHKIGMISKGTQSQVYPKFAGGKSIIS